MPNSIRSRYDYPHFVNEETESHTSVEVMAGLMSGRARFKNPRFYVSLSRIFSPREEHF